MSATHKNAGASVSIESALPGDQLGQIAANAVEKSGNVGQFVRLEESKSNQLTFSVRSRTSGGRVELMTFKVSLSSSGSRQRMVSAITSYKTKRKFIMGIIPLPKILLGFRPYQNFMQEFAVAVQAADPSAVTNVVLSKES